MFIIRPPRRKYVVGEKVGLTLISDTHIGCSIVDYGKLKKELEEARVNGDRVLINGDVFDLILPSDRKRYDPRALIPRLQGRADVINESIVFACEILGPYANMIDMIGCGNHDTATEKHHSIDPVRMLVDKLNDNGGSVAYGGYNGFVDYKFFRTENDDGSPGGTQRLIMYYHHGGGGSAPVTRGIIDFNRVAHYIDADILWLGHKHNRITDSTGVRLSCPKSGDAPIRKDVKCVMTGSYLDTMRSQSQADVLKNGRMSNYSEDAMMAPQAMGGARVVIKFSGPEFSIYVQQ